MSDHSAQSELRAGARALAPLLLGVIPFAFVTGVAAIDAGLSVIESLAMNVIVFAGASQLLTVELYSENALPWVIVLSAAGLNLRFMMYSASLAPYLSHMPVYKRLPFAYMLSDQAYAVSIFELERKAENPYRHFFFLGAAMTLYGAWQVGAWIGTFVGDLVPKSWSLEFAVPLTFLAVIVPALKSVPMLAAALVASVAAIVLRDLPPGTGLVVAAIVGILVGVSLERRTQ